MEQQTERWKVITPVETKNGKAFWMRIGSAFRNRDGSYNVYLDAFPTSGKLQIRPLDERDNRSRSASGADAFHRVSGELPQDQLPF